MRIFNGVDDFRSAGGEHLGTSPWLEITQERINAFADVTEDWQWIHVDEPRAARSELGRTVAHGYLTLSLIPRLSAGLFDFTGISRGLNYGLNKVRFPTFVHPGDRIRAHAELVSVIEVPAGTQGCVRYTVEVEGKAKPACVAESLMVIVG